MGDRTCPVENPDGSICGKPSRKSGTRGWCSMHQARWYKHGDFHTVKVRGHNRGMTPDERFWSKVDAEGDCWEWTSTLVSGYGSFFVGRGRRVLAHRHCYELLVGEIPKSLQIDHLCRNRRCINPDHLEPVPQQVNIARGLWGSWQRTKTHCPNGHPYSGDNLYEPPNKRNRVCRTCSRAAGRKYQADRRRALRDQSAA